MLNVLIGDGRTRTAEMDASVFRSAFCDQDGIVAHIGLECAPITTTLNRFGIENGQIVVQGRQIEVTGDNFVLLPTVTSIRPYYTIIYLTIDMGATTTTIVDGKEVLLQGTATLGHMESLTDYPSFFEGDDLSTNPKGRRSLVLYKFEHTNHGMAGVTRVAGLLDPNIYKSVFPLAKYAQTANLANDAKRANNCTNVIPSVGGNATNPEGRLPDSNVGERSVAFGFECVASEEFSTAVGTDAYATGGRSTAYGGGSSALKNDATAIGVVAQATGQGSTAVGTVARALHDNSMALGAGATTTQANEVVIGNEQTEYITSTASWSQTSDERDKTDIQWIRKPLDFIKRVRPVQYVLNPRERYAKKGADQDRLRAQYGFCEYDHKEHDNATKKNERKQVGVLAQQVVEALKQTYGSADVADIVHDNQAKMRARGINPPVESQLTVNYDGFIPFLIGAIQEQQKQIIDLRDEINELHDTLYEPREE